MAGASRASRPATGWLLTWERAGRTERLPLDRPLRIGRDPGLEVVLADPTVSRTHAIVSIVDGGPVVDASASRNGIRVDGVRTDHTRLAAGQQFAVGTTTFRVVTAAGPARPASTSSGVGASAVHHPRTAIGADRRPFLFVGIAAIAVVVVMVALALAVGVDNRVSTGSPGPLASAGLPSTAAWPAATLSAAGVTMRYPPGWRTSSSSDGVSVSFTPPGADASRESPSMSVTYVPGVTYSPSMFPPQSSVPVPISVAGKTGWEADGEGSLPPQNHYVILPVAGGVLFAVAYVGPNASLASDLDTLVSTIGSSGAVP